MSMTALLLAAAACGSDSEMASAAQTEGPAAQETRAGGRPVPTITLAPGDIATVGRESVEEATPITGDLRPIETIEVHAKLEGDLVGVYVREGQRVAAGELLARFESSAQESTRESAVADRASARTDLATAQWNLDQSAELFRAGAIAERDYKVAQQAVDAARARLAAAEARLRQSSLEARDTRVVAPAAGVVGKRLVENGERVARGAPMFTIVRNDHLELTAPVPARQANVVRAGQKVRFVADGRAFEGHVSRVSPTIDSLTRAITVYVDVANASGAIKGGTFASGRIVNRTVTGALTVPAAAIRQSQEGGHPFVYTIADNRVALTPVQVGVLDERIGKVQVLDGLSAGDRVIVGNVGVLGRGMQVQVVGGEQERASNGRLGQPMKAAGASAGGHR